MAGVIAGYQETRFSMTAKNDTFDYWVTPHVKIFTEVTYTYYPNNKGEIKQWDNSGSQSENN